MRLARFMIMAVFIGALLVPISAFADPYNDKWQGLEAENIYAWGMRIWEPWERVKPKKKYHIGVSIPSLGSPYFVNQAYALLTEAEATGVGLTILAAKGYEDLQGQISQIENLVNQRVDALIVSPMSAEGLAAITDRVSKKVPVFFIGEAALTENIAGYICENDYDIGYRCVDWLAKEMGGKGKIAILPGPPGNTYTETINRGAHGALRNYPGIKLVAEKWGDAEDPAVGQAVAENILNAHPDLGGFFVIEAQMMGVANAVKERKLEDKVLISAGYPFQETLSYIRDGSIDYGVTGYSNTNARILLNMIIRKLNGEKKVPKYVWTPGLEITVDVLDDFPRHHMWAPEGWQPPASMSVKPR